MTRPARPRALVLLLAVGLAALGAFAPAEAAHHAGKPKKPDVRKYSVVYTLSGHYQAVMDNVDESDGFCPGTGFPEKASFQTTNSGQVKLTMHKKGQLVFKRSLSKPNPLGTWGETGTTVAEGDDCATKKSEICSGTVISSDANATDYISVGTTASKVQFGSQLGGLPSEKTLSSDCDQTGDYFPGPAWILGGALGPYEQTAYTLSWSKLVALKKGHKLVGKATYVNPHDGYSIATCNHVHACKGTMTSFVSTITVKRTK